MTEFAKITLLIPINDDWPRPDKTNWQEVTDHNVPIVMLGCDYLTEDEMPADPTVGLTSINHGHQDEQQALITLLAAQAAEDGS